MKKRGFILGDYDTAGRGWTLTGWNLSAAKRKEILVDKPGGHGHWDLSTVLTDGEPVYEARTLTATLERSDGDRLSREAEIDDMVNTLDGRTLEILLPDATTSNLINGSQTYLSGVVHVERLYNDPAHASVAVTAICDPWRYGAERVRPYDLSKYSAGVVTALLDNAGRAPVVPLVTVTDAARLTYETLSWSLGPGSYRLPALVLRPGENRVTLSGTGVVTFTYREGVL